MNDNRTVNYLSRMDSCIAAADGETAKTGTPPAMLLHSCCAPCSTSVIASLSPHFAITVFYYNPNIDLPEEYHHRADEQRKLLEQLTTPNPVLFLEGEYLPGEFLEMAVPYAGECEGGIRCTQCYTMRLEKTAKTAAQRGIPWFCSTLSVSPLKDANRINTIGSTLGEHYSVSWLWSNFKKRDGYRKSVEMSRDYGLYRQDYCGCSFSRASSGISLIEPD